MASRHGLIGAGAIAAIFVAVAPSLAQPGDEPPGSDEQAVDLTADEAAKRMGMTPSEYIRHSRAVETVDAIEALVGGNAGYLGSAMDHQKGRVDVSWDEAVPIPKGLTSTGVGGFTVTVQAVPVSPGLKEWLSGRGETKDVPDVQGSFFDRKLGGFVVDVVEGTPTASMSADELQKAMGLPAPVVRINTEPRTARQLLSRWEDGGAHNPGSRAVNSQNGPCTAAFKVRKNGSGTALLMASHCGTGGFYNAGNYMGSVSGASYRTYNTARDISLIEGDSNGYGVSVYTGWYNSSTLNRVTSPATPTFGLSVCAGGAMSGEVCAGNRKVRSASVTA